MKILCSFITMSLMLVLSACGSSSGGSDPRDGDVQVVNAIFDSPDLRIEIVEDDEVISSFSGISFQESTASSSLPIGNYSIKIEYDNPLNGNIVTVYSGYDFSVYKETIHTIVVHGSYDSPQFEILEKDTNVEFSDDEEVDEFEIQVLNLSESTSAVFLGDQYMDVSTDIPLDVVVSGSHNLPVVIEDYENSLYRLQITDEGINELDFDSGEFDINPNTRSLLVICDAVGPDGSKKTAFLINPTMSQSFVNVAVGAYLRVVNLVSDEASTNIQLTFSTSQEVVGDDVIGFREIFNHGLIEPGFIGVKSISPSDSLLSKNTAISLGHDTYGTVVVAGKWEDSAISVGTISASLRPVANHANIQFINGVKETDIEDLYRVDLYAVPIGDSLSGLAPLFSQIDYMSGKTGVLAASTVDLVVTTAGTQSILAGPIRLNVESLSSVLVSVSEASGGGVPYSVFVHILDDEQ